MAVRICPRFWLCGESISKNAFRRFESGYGSKNPEMHLQNFEKLQSQKIAPIRFDGLGQEKSLEISVFFVFSCLHLNQTRIMCLQANSDADFVLANLDAARWHTSPLVKQGLASDRYLPGRNAIACKQIYVFLLRTKLAIIAVMTPEPRMTTISTGASTIPGIPAKKNPSPKR